MLILGLPIVAFRNFADEQMSHLVNSVFGSARALDYSKSLEKYAGDDHRSWSEDDYCPTRDIDQEEGEAKRIMEIFTSAQNDFTEAQKDFAQALAQQDFAQLQKEVTQKKAQRCTRDTEEPPRCPYRDSKDDLGTEDLRALCNFLVAKDHEEDQSSLPVIYTVSSPYSPLTLEQQHGLRDRNWREAFEDLVMSQEEQEATAQQQDPVTFCLGAIRDLNRVLYEKNLEGFDICKAIARLRGDEEHRGDFNTKHDPEEADYVGDDDDDDDDAEDPITELDLYKHFINAGESPFKTAAKESSTSQSDEDVLTHQSPLSSRNQEIKPNILSTLTTTERTTLPDGTIHTKVVLKKRFADGREECSETAHTQNPTPKTQYQPPRKSITDAISREGTSKGSTKDSNDSTKSKGWFWS